MKKIILTVLLAVFLILTTTNAFAFHIMAGANNKMIKNKLSTKFYLSTKNGKEFIGSISKSGRIWLGFKRIIKQKKLINGVTSNYNKKYNNGTYLANCRIDVKYNPAKHLINYLITNSTVKKGIFIYERKKLSISKVVGGKAYALNIPQKDLHFWYNSNFNTIYPNPKHGNYKTILTNVKIFKNGAENIIFNAVDGLQYVFFSNRSGTYAGLYIMVKGKPVNIIYIWRTNHTYLFKLKALNKFHVDIPKHFNIISFGTLNYAYFNVKI
jgi:hypothetical protein